MSAARPDSWMPLYWGDYARDTAHLGAAMHGAYLMLIKHYWCSGGPLPDNDAVLWRVATCDSPAQWKKMRPTIAAFFQVEGGEWRHKRVDEELSRAVEVTAERSAAGKAGARARWGKGNGGANGNRIANASVRQWQNDGQPQPHPPSHSEHPPDFDNPPDQISDSLPRANGHDAAIRPPSDNRRPGALGDVLSRFVTTGPPEKRLKRQDRADADMVRWLTTHGGFDVARAWALLMAARDDDDPGHTEAARELERISAKNRLGWFAEESA